MDYAVDRYALTSASRKYMIVKGLLKWLIEERGAGAREPLQGPAVYLTRPTRQLLVHRVATRASPKLPGIQRG